MKVTLEGSGLTVDLTQKDYLAQGGEGTVYVKGKTAFKVYHDPSKMIPVGKMTELSAITDPAVVRPVSFLCDHKGNRVGYTMPYIDGGFPLCQLFPKAFRDREGVTPAMMAELVNKMRSSIENVHAAGVLVVDMNEMNFMVNPKFDRVFFIDADSYETKHFPATAIMDSIRDWSVKSNRWTELSDWYSFGILSFQMFVGIHPFRGKYHGNHAEFRAKLPTDADDDAFAVTRRRMQANVSVLHPDVGIPPAAYPLTVIPKAYQDWYAELFVKGNRLPPPGVMGTVVAVKFMPKTTTLQGNVIEFTDFLTFDADIINFFASPFLGNPPVIETTGGVYMDRQIIPVPMHRAQVCGFTPKTGRVVVGTVLDGKLWLSNITDRAKVDFDMAVKEAMSYAGRIYVRTDDQIQEVILTDMGGKVIASPRPVANIMPYATRLYPGVAIQSMLGSVFVSLFVSSGAAQQVRIPELDKHRIIDAKFDSGVLIVVSENNGVYSRNVFRFDTDGTYDVRVVTNVPADYRVNFVVLDSGVGVCLTEDDKLELFANRKGSAGFKVVDDKALSGDMVLTKHAGTLCAYQGGKVFKMKLK